MKVINYFLIEKMKSLPRRESHWAPRKLYSTWKSHFLPQDLPSIQSHHFVEYLYYR